MESYLTSRIDFFTEVAELSRVSFSYTVHNSSIYIYFNETKLQRIVDNTITNAIKYTVANEKIHIDIRPFGTFVDMSVGSKSKEIKDKDKIFHAFYREENNRDGFGNRFKTG